MRAYWNRMWMGVGILVACGSMAWPAHAVTQPPKGDADGEVEFGKRPAPPPRDGGIDEAGSGEGRTRNPNRPGQDGRPGSGDKPGGGMPFPGGPGNRPGQGDRPAGGDRPGGGPPGMEAYRELVPAGMAIFFAMDLDGDRNLSQQEIAKASQALLKLDSDGDGILTLEEMRPERMMMMMSAAKSREGGNPPPATPMDAMEMNPEMVMQRLRSMDKNGDGALSKEEAPERIQRNFERIDANADGKVDEEEVRRMLRAQMGREMGNAGGRERPEDGRPNRPNRPGGNRPKESDK